MKLKDYKEMEVGKVYHFDNMELKKDEDGMLYSKYLKYV